MILKRKIEDDDVISLPKKKRKINDCISKKRKLVQDYDEISSHPPLKKCKTTSYLNDTVSILEYMKRKRDILIYT